MLTKLRKGQSGWQAGRQAVANTKRDNSKTSAGKTNSERQVRWDYKADGK